MIEWLDYGMQESNTMIVGCWNELLARVCTVDIQTVSSNL